MVKHLPGINHANLKRIAAKINNKLGGNNIDESTNIFETNYYKLT